jgi:hypothetical protein
LCDCITDEDAQAARRLSEHRTFGEFFYGKPVLQIDGETVVSHNLPNLVAVYKLPPGLHANLLGRKADFSRFDANRGGPETGLLMVNGLLPETQSPSEWGYETIMDGRWRVLSGMMTVGGGGQQVELSKHRINYYYRLQAAPAALLYGVNAPALIISAAPSGNDSAFAQYKIVIPDEGRKALLASRRVEDHPHLLMKDLRDRSVQFPLEKVRVLDCTHVHGK